MGWRADATATTADSTLYTSDGGLVFILSEGLGYTLPANRMHYALPVNRLHYTLPEED